MTPTIGKEKLVKLAKEILAARGIKLTETALRDAVDAIFEGIIESVQKGETVQLIGFGTFVPRDRAARMGRNINSGESFEIPAMKTVAFTPAKAFKGALNT